MTTPDPAQNTRPHFDYYTGRAVVNLAAIRHNVALMREKVRSHSPHTQIMAVVKGGAYGHGLIESARASAQGGATWFGTAQASEALELRRAGFDQRILTWLHTPGIDFAELIRHDIDISVAGPWAVSAVRDAAREVGKPARVHLKVDTGLGRNGVTLADLDQMLVPLIAAQDEGTLEFVGIWSHFAFADEPENPTVLAQAETFKQAIAQAEAAGAHLEVRHLANSAATLLNPSVYYDLVRPGLSVYGLSPAPQIGDAAHFGLIPAMTLEADIATVKKLPAGHGVSYSHQYHTEEDTRIGVVPLGYADGIFRHASGTADRGGLGAPIQIGDQRVSIAGRVCMDQFVVDLGPDTRTVPGDTAILFGDPATGVPGAEDWAVAAGTISYEIVTRVGERVPRVYIDDEPV
ncbi:alanine racemase [Populibacterium corticicola]|uniref:Alanine racemase n=1 Tax=Populibacterium corticicola TaxID=1812826 RepID=A0ABW5XJG4_9MICO